MSAAMSFTMDGVSVSMLSESDTPSYVPPPAAAAAETSGSLTAYPNRDKSRTMHASSSHPTEQSSESSVATFSFDPTTLSVGSDHEPKSRRYRDDRKPPPKPPSYVSRLPNLAARRPNDVATLDRSSLLQVESVLTQTYSLQDAIQNALDRGEDDRIIANLIAKFEAGGTGGGGGSMMDASADASYEPLPYPPHAANEPDPPTKSSEYRHRKIPYSFGLKDEEALCDSFAKTGSLMETSYEQPYKTASLESSAYDPLPLESPHDPEDFLTMVSTEPCHAHSDSLVAYENLVQPRPLPVTSGPNPMATLTPYVVQRDHMSLSLGTYHSDVAAAPKLDTCVNVIQITNGAPSDPTAHGIVHCVAPAGSSAEAIYLLDVQNGLGSDVYYQECKRQHELFLRAKNHNEKEVIQRTLVRRLEDLGGLFLKTVAGEISDMTDLEKLEKVWNFLVQKCYVSFNISLDVRKGRGGHGKRFAGNQRYLDKKDVLRRHYAGADHDTKNQIAQELVDWVHAVDGRFVDKDPDDRYFIVDYKVVLEKAKQALREARKG